MSQAVLGKYGVRITHNSTNIVILYSHSIVHVLRDSDWEYSLNKVMV